MADSDHIIATPPAKAQEQELRLMLKSDALAGQHILVTGGGTGLGRIMAQAFASLQGNVHICGRRRGPVEETASAILESGGSARAHVCDIRDEAAIDAMLDVIWAEHPLTGLVNNAAGNFINRTEDISMNGFDAISSIVFRGTFAMTHACGKRWIAEKRKASVLSILATWVWNGSAFTVPSAMSKAGIKAMTQSLAVEWGRYGIRLNAIAPGPFPTEGVAARLRPIDDARDALGEEDADNPMKRVGRPSELGNLAAFLMAPGVEFINGETIAIDGGRWLATGGNFSHLTEWGDPEWREATSRIRATDAAEKNQRG